MWEYDPGERRGKHRWNHNFPGFVTLSGKLVGKCSSDITKEIAKRLINTGVPYVSPRSNSGYPQYIYNVYRGAVYVARPTIPGRSYHGHPMKGPVPRGIVAQLTTKAEREGTLDEFRKWLKDHIEVGNL